MNKNRELPPHSQTTRSTEIVRVAPSWHTYLHRRDVDLIRRSMREERRQEVRAKLVARLQRVRGQMTDAEFDNLLKDVERTARRFSEIDRAWPRPKRESPPNE